MENICLLSLHWEEMCGLFYRISDVLIRVQISCHQEQQQAQADKECLKCGAFESDKTLIFTKTVGLHSFYRKAFKQQLQYVCKYYSKLALLEIELFFFLKLQQSLKFPQTIQYIWFLPCKDPMALWTHLHTCSSSSTLSMGECVLCISTSFFFTLSTSRLSGTPVRTPSRSMAVSPFNWSMFWVRRWLEPSSLCNATSALSRWDLRGLSTQENMARSSARSGDRGRGSLCAFYVQLWDIFENRIACVFLFIWSCVGEEMCQHISRQDAVVTLRSWCKSRAELLSSFYRGFS